MVLIPTYQTGITSPADYVRPQEVQFLPEHLLLGRADPLRMPQHPPVLGPERPRSPLHVRHCREKVEEWAEYYFMYE